MNDMPWFMIPVCAILGFFIIALMCKAVELLGR